jgi:hypothetical protein
MLALAAILAVAAGMYARSLSEVVVFGDAAEHARIAQSIAEDGAWDVQTRYPLLYHALAAPFIALSADDGLQAFTVLSLLFLGAGVFLLARQLTGSAACGLAAAAMSLMAPVTVFYAGRMYMEIFLSAMFVWSAFTLARYFERPTAGRLVLCAIACALTAATKQQGLLLVASVGAVLAARAVTSPRLWTLPIDRTRVVHFVAFAGITAMIAAPAYLAPMRSAGGILPETEYTGWVNATARAATGIDRPVAGWEERWSDRLEASFEENGGERGFRLAERRHVWPWDVFTTQRGFWGIHTLYWGPSEALRYPPYVTLPVLALFTAGIACWAWQQRRSPFTAFLALFLLANYATFLRNNDQARYHVYIAFMLAFAVPFAVLALSRALRGRRALTGAGFAALAALLAVAAVRDLPSRLDTVEASPGLQAYAPSEGGMASVQDAGAWLDAHLAEDETFFAVPANEYSYYSDRRGVFVYSAYFLRDIELIALIDDIGARYVVVADSAVQPDSRWNNVVKMPASFANRVRRLYARVYTTPAGDISIFDTRSLLGDERTAGGSATDGPRGME